MAKKQPPEFHLNVPALHMPDAAAWRSWLEKNHATEEAVFLIIYRKESGIASVYYNEALDEALCFGWIDSKINKRDAVSYYQYFARRKPKSNWSAVNKRKVAKLIGEKRMRPAGMASIELAQKTGTWTALDAVENTEIPADLAEALAARPKAREYFEAFPRSTKRGILEWILNAKQPETRRKRITETAELAAKNERANQYRPK